MNIVPRWYIEGRSKLASFDIPTRDKIHQYQCNNPIILTIITITETHLILTLLYTFVLIYCRIRTRLFKAMKSYKDSLKKSFLSLTQDDPLHPLLLPENLEDLNSKFRQTLAFMDLCTNLESTSEVLLDM